ncbi:uncharacterized protein BHQ10_000964 [Talaromyces amestolkiae]|uniref:Uncharacterized protein n=1 Tax=Talaromyces amestolkiae TaxID=1196081 RepID=A0A364KN28_TALAM|nr:uncharacterized protein BHQ10_000964 [Talaromyces amestolkiae]RAO64952.1 hypothetical protein BHQ10_000964 [Talaromyces amestolkiae]
MPKNEAVMAKMQMNERQEIIHILPKHEKQCWKLQWIEKYIEENDRQTENIAVASAIYLCNLLLVKMEYEPHSTAAAKFGSILMKHPVLMNKDKLEKKLTPIGSAHFRALDRTKRAAAAFQPRRLGTSRDRNRHWPSLVVEVGFPNLIESSRKMR